MTVREPLTTEDFARRSVRCWACEYPLPSTNDPENPGDHYCHGCREFFCGRPSCPATEHEMDLPFGGHHPVEHLGDADDDEDEDEGANDIARLS